MSHWILCGLPHCGKTTQAKKLAQALDRLFIDTDEETEKLYEKKMGIKRTSREISKHEGVQFFRDLEKEALMQVQPKNSAFIALGGGTLLDPKNREYVNRLGKLIYLQAKPTEILPRILRKGMPTYLDPLNPEASLQRLAEERTPIYAAVADFQVDTSGKEEQEVFNLLYNRIVNNGK